MWLKHCAHCQRTFVAPKAEELGLVFCQDCVRWCNQYAPLIFQYTQNHPNATLNDISHQLKVPIAFITALVKQHAKPTLQQKPKALAHARNANLVGPPVSPAGGERTGMQDPMHHSVQAPRPCNICGRAMKLLEDVYCHDCDRIVSLRLFSRYPGTRQKPPVMAPKKAPKWMPKAGKGVSKTY